MVCIDCTLFLKLCKDNCLKEITNENEVLFQCFGCFNGIDVFGGISL